MRYVMMITILCVACGGTVSVDAPAPPKQLQVINYLYSPSMITIDGASYGTVGGGNGFGPRTVVLTIPGPSHSLTYSVQPILYSDGTPVPQDLNGESVTLPDGSGTLGINNIVGSNPYFMVSFSAANGASYAVAISRSGIVQCLGVHPPSSIVTFWGYYLLTSTTEVRYYAPTTRCTGSYRYWDAGVLGGFAANTGVIGLRATVAP